MHILTATNAYGPEYYRALLAQSEDEIVKLKRSTPVLGAIEYMRREWRKCVLLSLVRFLS